jgi:hypothetical protein
MTLWKVLTMVRMKDLMMTMAVTMEFSMVMTKGATKALHCLTVEQFQV